MIFNPVHVKSFICFDKLSSLFLKPKTRLKEFNMHLLSRYLSHFQSICFKVYLYIFHFSRIFKDFCLLFDFNLYIVHVVVLLGISKLFLYMLGP